MRGPVFRFGLAGFPFGQREEVALGVGGRAGGRVEAGLVGVAGLHGLGHGVVDFQDGFLGAVGAVLFLVLPLYDREGVHDVGDGVAGFGEMQF